MTFGDFVGISADFQLVDPTNTSGEITIRAFRWYGNFKETDFITEDGPTGGKVQLNAHVVKFHDASPANNNGTDYLAFDYGGAWGTNYGTIGWDGDNPNDYWTKESSFPSTYTNGSADKGHWPDADDSGPFYFGTGISGNGAHVVQRIKNVKLIVKPELAAFGYTDLYSEGSGFADSKPAFAGYTPFPAQAAVPYRGTDVPVIVTFNANGHGNPQRPIAIPSGTTLAQAKTLGNILNVATVGAFSFDGWATTATGAAIEDTYVFNANTTLYTLWEEDLDYVPPPPSAAHPSATGAATEIILDVANPTWINGTSGNQIGWTSDDDLPVGAFTWARYLEVNVNGPPQGLEVVWGGKIDSSTDFGGWNQTVIFGWSATDFTTFDGVTVVTVEEPELDESDEPTGNMIIVSSTVTIELKKVIKDYATKFVLCEEFVELLFQKGSWVDNVNSAKLIIPAEADWTTWQ